MRDVTACLLSQPQINFACPEFAKARLGVVNEVSTLSCRDRHNSRRLLGLSLRTRLLTTFPHPQERSDVIRPISDRKCEALHRNTVTMPSVKAGCPCSLVTGST